MEDSTLPAALEAALAAAQAALRDLVVGWVEAPTLALGTIEAVARARLHEVGAGLVAATLAARGTGKTGPRRPCACGGEATFEGYRRKEVQTLLGWVAVRRAYYHRAQCGRGQVPLDAALGVGRAGHSPEVRRLASRLGGLLPFGQAAATLLEAAGVRLSPSSLGAVTEAAGARREAAVHAAVERAWRDGLPAAAGTPPDRLYVAMDGVRILGSDGEGREIKVGVVAPRQRGATEEERGAASYAAGLEPAAAFGRRLALEAQRRGLEGAGEVVVLGDGAAWIWNLAAEHFPTATQIVDWYHASERIWELGRARSGDGTAQTARWVERQLDRLARGQVRRLVASWRRLTCHGAAAAVRDEQVTYFTNQAGRMAYDRYRDRGLDVGSGMVEGAGACKHLIGAREKGPGMRWSEAGAQRVAAVRVALFNGQGADLAAAA